MKKIMMLPVLCAVLTFGCTQKIVVAEVLQQSETDKIYTRYNIFYTDPGNISCLNLLQGNIIPYGTEVEIVGCTEKELSFRAAGSEKIYSIKFSKGERMTSMQNYIRSVFGFEDRDAVSKKIRPQYLAKVQAGEISPGMTKDEISVAWGKVPPVHTPDEKNMTWIYMKSHHDLIRLIFKGQTLRTTMPKLQDAE